MDQEENKKGIIKQHQNKPQSRFSLHLSSNPLPLPKSIHQAASSGHVAPSQNHNLHVRHRAHHDHRSPWPH